MRSLAILGVLGFVLLACQDKAKPDLEKGIEEEQKGNTSAALAAYGIAKAKSPKSNVGMEATKRADAIREKKSIEEKRQAEEQRHQAGRVLHEHPNLPFEIKSEWFDRVRGYLRGDVTEDTCPQLKDIPVTADEFERKTARDRAIGQCRPENERAVNYLKSCPFTTDLTYGMELEEYNFERQAFTIKDGTTKWLKKSTVATSGRVWLHNDIFVTWPGAYSSLSVTTDDLVRSQEFCNGLNAVERENIRDAFLIDLKISEPEAKALKDKIKSMTLASEQIHVIIEAALLLDGQTGQDTFSCGSKPIKPVPTGRVVAWRFVVFRGKPVIDWISTGQFDLTANCDEAQAYLGTGKPSVAATTSSSSSATSSASPPSSTPPRTHGKEWYFCFNGVKCAWNQVCCPGGKAVCVSDTGLCEKATPNFQTTIGYRCNRFTNDPCAPGERCVYKQVSDDPLSVTSNCESGE